jgi:sodium-dependent dicarboxylate transporter 2/3/5
MALALEKWICTRLALRILSHLGGSPFKILCGFMLASAFYPCGCLIQRQQ